MESNRADVQARDGPYGAYLRRVISTIGDAAFDALCELDRPAWVADLLLAPDVVPYPLSIEAKAFERARAQGRTGIEFDEKTRRRIRSLLVAIRTARSAAPRGAGESRAE